MKNPLFQDTGPKSVRRGGSWFSGAGYTRVSHRHWDKGSYHLYRLSFRLFYTKEK